MDRRPRAQGPRGVVGRRAHRPVGNQGELASFARMEERWHTDSPARQFIATSVEDAKPRSQLRVRLNLPALTSLTPERIKELAGTKAEIEENGWGAFDAAGFDLSESTKMQIASLSSL